MKNKLLDESENEEGKGRGKEKEKEKKENKEKSVRCEMSPDSLASAAHRAFSAPITAINCNAASWKYENTAGSTAFISSSHAFAAHFIVSAGCGAPFQWRSSFSSWWISSIA